MTVLVIVLRNNLTLSSLPFITILFLWPLEWLRSLRPVIVNNQ